MTFELEAPLVHIGEIQQKTENFRIREFVLEEKKKYKKKQYSELIPFQVFNDQCEMFDSIDFQEALKHRLPLKVKFAPSGREWNGKYFLTLKAISVELTIKQSSTESLFESPMNNPPSYEPVDTSPIDLPF